MELDIIWGLLCFVAAFTQAVIGFGYGGIFIGVGAFLMPLDQVIVLSFIFACIIEIILVVLTVKYGHIKEALTLAGLGLIGLPIGMRIFYWIDVEVLQLIFGIFLVLCSVISFLNQRSLPNHKSVTVTVGVGSGVLGALFGASGPFIALYLMTRPELKRQHHILILNTIFLLLSAVLTMINVQMGSYDDIGLHFIAQAGAVIAAGTMMGYIMGNRISDRLYRKVVLIVILVMGIMLIVTG